MRKEIKPKQRRLQGLERIKTVGQKWQSSKEAWKGGKQSGRYMGGKERNQPEKESSYEWGGKTQIGG